MKKRVISFLAGCLFAFAFAVAAADGSHARPPLDARPTLRGFQGYMGEPFQVWGGDGARAVETLHLVAIEDAGSNARIEQFILRFRAELTSTLGKAVYSFKHPESGYFDLWLDPAGQDERGRYFEARFSLIPESARP